MKYIVNDKKFNFLPEAKEEAKKSNSLLTTEEEILFPFEKKTMRLVWETANLLDDSDNLYLLYYEGEHSLGRIPKGYLVMFGHLYYYEVILKGDLRWKELVNYIPEPLVNTWQVYINGERVYQVSGTTARRIKNFLLKSNKDEDSNIYGYLISLILIDSSNKSTTYLWRKNTPQTDLVVMEIERKLF